MCLSYYFFITILSLFALHPRPLSLTIMGCNPIIHTTVRKSDYGFTIWRGKPHGNKRLSCISHADIACVTCLSWPSERGNLQVAKVFCLAHPWAIHNMDTVMNSTIVVGYAATCAIQPLYYFHYLIFCSGTTPCKQHLLLNTIILIIDK